MPARSFFVHAARHSTPTDPTRNQLSNFAALGMHEMWTFKMLSPISTARGPHTLEVLAWPEDLTRAEVLTARSSQPEVLRHGLALTVAMRQP